MSLTCAIVIKRISDVLPSTMFIQIDLFHRQKRLLVRIATDWSTEDFSKSLKVIHFYEKLRKEGNLEHEDVPALQKLRWILLSKLAAIKCAKGYFDLYLSTARTECGTGSGAKNHS